MSDYPLYMPAWRPEPTVGWPGFLAWSLGGALASFSFAAAASVGLFIMPLAVALIYLLTRYATNSRDRWGFVAGMGGVLVFLGVLNIDYRPCSDSPVVVLQSEGSSSCGGFDGRVFFVIGLAVIATALIFYYRSRRHLADG